MKKKTLLITGLLVLALIAGACGSTPVPSATPSASASSAAASSEAPASESAAPAEETREPITISAITGLSPTDPKWEDSEIGKQLLEKLNVTLEIEYIVTDAQTKESVLLASGSYPDVIAGSINSQNWIDQGAVIPLQELYLEHAPNLKAWYDRANQDVLKQWASEDGNTYKLPITSQVAWNDGFNPGAGFMIQAKVLKEAGWPKIKTLDQYWKLIEDYVAANPTIDGKQTIGYVVKNQAWQFDSVSDNPTQLVFGYHDDGGFLNQKQPDGTYQARVASGSVEEEKYLRFMTEKFEKGLVDPEGFVEDNQQWQAKMSSGRVVGYFGWWYEMGDVNNALREQGMADREYVMFPLVWEDGIQEKWYAMSEDSVASGIMITNTAKDPVRIMQFLDDLSKEENTLLAEWGEEGVDFSVKEDGTRYLTEEQILTRRDKEKATKRGLAGAKVVFPGFGSAHSFADGTPYSPRLLPEYNRMALSDTMKEYLDAYGYDSPGSAYTLFTTDYGFTWSIPVPGDTDAGLAAAQLDALQREMQPKILMGGAANFDKLYAEYKDKLGKIPLDAYHEYLTTEINKRIAERKK